MKPSKIFDVMDLARKVTQNGGLFHPLFVGAPGIAKSENVKVWAHRHNLPLIDLRGAYLEAPDVIGYPTVMSKNGRQITVHNIPEFWPDVEGSEEGVLFVDELNRSTTAVMNVFMQLLTDKKIHTYNFPKKWIIASAVNPENAEHDVNTMDAALKNRFIPFQIDYDKRDFVDYMTTTKFNPIVVQFVDSGAWSYKAPEDIGDTPGNKYTSPRTIKQLDEVVKAGIPEEMQMTVFEAILGSNYGKAFYTFMHNEQPVTYEDLVASPKKALVRLAQFSDPNNYKYGHLGITTKDILETNKISDELLAKVLVTLPADVGYKLLQDLQFKRNDQSLLGRMMNIPEVHKYMKSNLKEAAAAQS